MQPQQQPMIQPHFQAQQAWQQQLQQSQQRQAMPRLAQLPQASQQQQPQPFPQAWQPPQQQQQAWQPQQQQQQQPPQLHANGCQGQHPNRHHQDEYYARPGQTPIRLPALDPDPDPAYLHDFAMKAAMMDAAMMTGFGTAGSSPSCSPLGSPSQYDYEDTAMDPQQESKRIGGSGMSREFTVSSMFGAGWVHSLVLKRLEPHCNSTTTIRV